MSFRMSLVVFCCAVCITGFTVGWFIKPTPTPNLDKAWELIQEKIDKKEIYFASTVELIVEKNMKADILKGIETGLSHCIKRAEGNTPDTIVVIISRTLPHGYSVMGKIIMPINQ